MGGGGGESRREGELKSRRAAFFFLDASLLAGRPSIHLFSSGKQSNWRRCMHLWSSDLASLHESNIKRMQSSGRLSLCRFWYVGSFSSSSNRLHFLFADLPLPVSISQCNIQTRRRRLLSPLAFGFKSDELLSPRSDPLSLPSPRVARRRGVLFIHSRAGLPSG